MSILDAFRSALGALAAYKLRSALTMLGIIIGVTAVIALMSIGRGAERLIYQQIESIGTNLLFIQPQRSTEGRVQGAGSTLASLTLEDAEALADPALAPLVMSVSPQVSLYGQAVVGSLNTRAQIIGTTPEFQQVRNYKLVEGDFILPEHVQGRSWVAVLGANVAKTLFPDGDPVGQRVRINNRQFRVIGVLASKGGSAMGFQDDTIIVPITTATSRLRVQRAIGGGVAGGVTVDLINVQVADTALVADAKEQVAEILRERHKVVGQDDFLVTSQEDMAQTLTQVTSILTFFLGAVAGISLLVGGIGIMNIMLVAVAERTREIGIRKAVGARRTDVMLQFLVESVILSISGGILGVLGGWGLSRLITRIQFFNNQPLPSVVSSDIVALALGVAIGIGLFFGLYPASRAASLDPIQALRHE